MSGVGQPRVAVIGAGMSGLLCGIRLKDAGITDFTIYEKADRVGGTWRENTYPGLACDVPSHLYRYTFAPNPEWSHRFSPGAEIQAYFEKTAADFGLESSIRYNTEITRCEFAEGRWKLEGAGGLRDTVDFVICATGVLHHPQEPEIEGLDSFAGATFHSARWDHDVPLDGKRIGVIGTGSTAIQITDALVDRVAHLALFQRTVFILELVRDHDQFVEAPLEALQFLRKALVICVRHTFNIVSVARYGQMCGVINNDT